MRLILKAHRNYYESFSAFVDMALSLFPCTQFPSKCGFPRLESGIYLRSAELWIERFKRHNVHVVRAEDFFDDLVATVCGIHKFLGLPPVAPEIREVVKKTPMKIPPPDREAFARLTEFYRPWNERLYKLLGHDMGWDVPGMPE